MTFFIDDFWLYLSLYTFYYYFSPPFPLDQQNYWRTALHTVSLVSGCQTAHFSEIKNATTLRVETRRAAVPAHTHK